MKEEINNTKKQLKIISDNISFIVENKYYFEKFKKYIENSKTINQNNDFIKFIALNYRDVMVINVCKQADEDNRAESLVNLLKNIKKNKKLFTIDWFTNQYPKWLLGFAINDFRKFSTKNNKIVSCQKINKDIKKIKRAIVGRAKNSLKSLKKFRNKRVAHYDKDKFKTTTTINDLNDAVSLLEALVLKYELLVNQTGMDRLLPVDPDPKLQNLFK